MLLCAALKIVKLFQAVINSSHYSLTTIPANNIVKNKKLIFHLLAQPSSLSATIKVSFKLRSCHVFFF